MSNDHDAIYHLQKMIGLYKEIEAHDKELKKLGINIYPLDSSTNVCVKSGIENFGIPLNMTPKTKSFKHLGVEVWE